MKINPIACDSLGVQTMATFVTVGNLNVLIDPGVSVLDNKQGLGPHKMELNFMNAMRDKIVRMAKEADIITVSHYHYDHYIPPFDRDVSDIYKGKIVFAKDRRSKCNFEQRKRGKKFELVARNMAKEFKFSDGLETERNNILFKFSVPLWHGEEGSQLGYVNMVSIEHKGEKLLHTSDVEGPVTDGTTELIVKEDPTFIILDGPRITDAKNNINLRLIKKAEQNILKILMETRVKKILMDHHVVRTLNYRNYIEDIYKVAKELKKEIISGAEFFGRPERLLEAKREELWENESN